MPCLEPGKKLSKEAQKILSVLKSLGLADKVRIAQEAQFAPPLVARKLRELRDKALIKEEAEVYSLTDTGIEAASLLEGSEA